MNKLFRMAALACAALCCCGQSGAEAGRVLHLAANTWEPYVGADLPGQGIASEIVLTALKRAGYAADIRFMPWSRALASAYSGSIDGLVGVWPTSQRRARLVYSDSYLSNELYLFYVKPNSTTCHAQHFAGFSAYRGGRVQEGEKLITSFSACAPGMSASVRRSLRCPLRVQSARC